MRYLSICMLCLMTCLCGCETKEEPTESISLSSLKEIALQDIVQEDTISYFYSCDFLPVDPLTYTYETNTVDADTTISTTFLEPVLLVENHPISKDDLPVSLEDHPDTIALQSNGKADSYLSSIEGKDSVIIFEKLSKLKGVEEESGTLSVYFYPYCYKVNDADTTKYIAKAGILSDKYSDGLYEIRITQE